MDARALLDLLPTPVALVDADLRVLARNRAFDGPLGGSHPPSLDVHQRHDLWTSLGAAIARMQPAARHGRFRWVGGHPEPRPWDVRLTRVDDSRFLLHAEDVSDRAVVESIQSGVRGYVERVLNHIDLAMVGLDAAMRVTFYNRVQIELWRRGGWTAAADAVGEPVASVWPVFDPPRWESIRQDLARHQAVRHARVAWAAAGGLLLDVSVLPLHGPAEDPSGAVCVTEIVTGS